MDEEVDDPSEKHVIVDGEEGYHDEHGLAYAFEEGTELPQFHGTWNQQIQKKTIRIFLFSQTKKNYVTI